MRVVQLHGPADAPFADLVRLASLAVGSQAGLSIDACDELRLAVDEACFALIAVDPQALDVTFIEDEATLSVSIRTKHPVAFELDAEATLVLQTMTDHFAVAAEGALILQKRLN
jgi:hypothetical protein